MQSVSVNMSRPVGMKNESMGNVILETRMESDGKVDGARGDGGTDGGTVRDSGVNFGER